MAATSTFANADTERPTVTITADEQPLPGVGSAVVGGLFTATITFSEVVTGFKPDSFRVTGAGLGGILTVTPGLVWTVVVIPLEKTGSIEIGSGAVKDSASNLNQASSGLSFYYTPDSPSVEIKTSASAFPGANGKVNVLFSFSQSVTGFTVSDIVVGNGAPSNFKNHDFFTYSATITADESGNPVTIDVPAGAAQNILNADSDAAVQVSLNIDPDATPNTDQPTLEITGVPTEYDQSTLPFQVTFKFSEPVYGFDVSDIVITGATLSAYGFVTQDYITYSAFAKPSGSSGIRISVPEGVAENLSGNGNKSAQAFAKGQYSDSLGGAADFISTRANHILINQPDMIGFVTGDNNNDGGPLGNLQLKSDPNSHMTMSFYTSRSKILAAQDALSLKDSKNGDASGSADRVGTFDIWTQIQGSQSENQKRKAKLWTAGFGTHYFLEQNMLIGLMGQFDWANETNSTSNSKITGTGFMVGPYLSGKIEDQALYYEARALWGQSDNKISPNGTYEDKFKTDRLLASVKLEGSHDLDAFNLGDIHIDNMKLKPSVSLSYFEEVQKSYTDSNSLVIPEQKVSLGEFRFGPSLTRSFDLDGEMGESYSLSTNLGVSGIVNFGVENYAVANSPSISHLYGNSTIRARIDGGVTVEHAHGIKYTVTGFYDGVGVKNYSSYGGKLGILVPLN